MNDVTEKYVAKALEGYEQNFEGISEAITQMETQLKAYKLQQVEMEEGIAEMKEVLGLDAEEDLGGNAAPLELVKEDA